MKNKKGFTLVELLIAVTILGIILSFSIVIITKLTTKNKETEYRIYIDTVLQASKIYNDEYSIDTFANREYGCTKVGYSTLLEKKLLSDVALKGVKCGYTVSGKDSSGVVIRKVKDKYYYEVVLFCKDTESTNKTKDYVSGVEHDYFYELGDDYCNTEATTDDQPPKVSYRNNKYRLGHFYNKDNLPQPQVKIGDSGVGLNNISDINYQWDSKSNKMELLRFTVAKGTGSTAWKNVPLTSKITNPNTNGVDHLKVTIKNLQDLAGNDHEREDWDGEYTKFNGTTKKDRDTTFTETGTYYIDNTMPEITVSNKKTWTNQTFTITMNVEDKKVNGIRSGIKEVTYKLTSTYADPGNSFEETKKSDNPPENGLNGNYEAARGGSTSDKFKKTLTINKSGSYTLKVTVEDWSGNKTSKTYTDYYQYDNIKPDCGRASTNDSTAWINSNRTVSVKCGDQTNLSQCTQNSYSKTFGESYTGTIQIKDHAGNTRNCTVITRVDKTKPNCSSRGGNNNWRSSNLTIYGDCSDTGSVQSGCAQSTYSKLYSGNNDRSNGYGGRAYDVAGNWRDCSQNQDVHIDVTFPSCYITAANQNVAVQELTLTTHCNDSYSGIKICDYTTDYYRYTGHGRRQETNVMYNVSASHTSTVEDLAGNRSTCRAAVQASTCTVIEIIASGKNSACEGYYCGSYWCSSGWPVNGYARVYQYDGFWYTQRFWDCKGYKTYTRNASKCGYHIS